MSKSKEGLEAGLSFLNKGKLSEAAERFSSAIADIDYVMNALFYRGVTMHRGGNKAQAQRDIQLAVKFNDRFLSLARNLGLSQYVENSYGRIEEIHDNVNVAEQIGNRKVRHWPDGMNIKNIHHIKKIIKSDIVGGSRDPFLKKGDKVITFGSCFANNIGRFLSKSGYDVLNYLIPEDVNSTFSNFHMFRWINSDGDDKYTKYFDVLYGPERKKEIVNAIKECRSIVMTVGVAPCLFNVDTGAFAFTTPKNDRSGFEYDPGSYALRTTTVDENVQNTSYILRSIQKINNSAMVTLSVSPVPLSGTNEFESIIVADCLSKSVMRLTAHYITSMFPHVVYWPSFEIVRWLGSHSDFRLFGADDNHARHVNMEIVDLIMQTFLDTYEQTGEDS